MLLLLHLNRIRQKIHKFFIHCAKALLEIIPTRNARNIQLLAVTYRT